MHVLYARWERGCVRGSAYLPTLLDLGFRLASSEGQERAHIGDVLQAFEEGDEVQEVVVRGVVDPAFDGDGVVWT